MSEVTQLLVAIAAGDEHATAELLPVVYEELRRIARARMANERAEHTLQATALVHEAYLRLIGDANPGWDGRGHFFTAAAEAMRRILIEHARSKHALKRGGQHRRVELECDGSPLALSPDNCQELLALDEALSKLAAEAPAKAELVKLRFFAGMTIEEAAEALSISPTTAKRHWAYAKAWLLSELEQAD